MHSRGKVAKELGQALLHLKLRKHTLALEKLVISPHLTTQSRRCVGSYMGKYFPATVNFILIKYMKMKFGGLAKHSPSLWPSEICIHSYSHTKNTFTSFLRDIIKSLSNHFIRIKIQDLWVMYRLFH